MKLPLRIASLLSVGLLFFPVPDLWSANLNADYAGAPPFISATVIPNILLLMDNSGSMMLRVDCPNYPVCPAWDAARATPYSGLFDPEACYQYDATDTRFRMPSAVSVHIGAQGSSGDGQVVNGTGCKSRTSVIVQKSTGAMGQTCVRGGAAGNPFSEMLTWRDL